MRSFWRTWKWPFADPNGRLRQCSQPQSVSAQTILIVHRPISAYKLQVWVNCDEKKKLIWKCYHGKTHRFFDGSHLHRFSGWDLIACILLTMQFLYLPLAQYLNKLNKTFCPGEFQLIYQKSPSKHHSYYSYSNSYCYSRVIFQFLIKTHFSKAKAFPECFHHTNRFGGWYLRFSSVNTKSSCRVLRGIAVVHRGCCGTQLGVLLDYHWYFLGHRYCNGSQILGRKMEDISVADTSQKRAPKMSCWCC